MIGKNEIEVVSWSIITETYLIRYRIAVNMTKNYNTKYKLHVNH